MAFLSHRNCWLLNATVTELGKAGTSGASIRADILKVLKEAHASGRAEIRRRFEERIDAREPDPTLAPSPTPTA